MFPFLTAKFVIALCTTKCDIAINHYQNMLLALSPIQQSEVPRLRLITLSEQIMAV
jgi:hypothetical protein